MRAARDSWVNPALALVLCAATGALFAWLRIPLPWMTGPLLAMAACNFAGAELRSPPGARSLGQVVIGTALGLYFTPVVGREVAQQWWVLVVAALVAILLGVLGGWVLSRASGIDAKTAFFASVPGGAAEMAVPFAMTYSGAHGADTYSQVAVPLRWEGLGALLALSAAAAWLLDRLRMPNAFFFGPLAMTIALTVNGVQLTSLPTTLTNPAQMLLGCALGARFERRSLESVPRYVSAVLASVFVALLVSAGFGWVVGALAGLSVPSMILAMAPGGIAEMCITAKVLQLGVPLVTAAHVVRVLVLIVTTGPAFRAAQALQARVRNR